MCKNPIYISNPKRCFNVYRDTVGLCVPCGHCEQCRAASQLNWFTRAYYEYLDCRRHGGFCVNFTLTFNPENLPRFNDIPCFDKKRVQLFVKRVQSALSRFLGLKHSECRIKYIICSEYGGQTHRPHHHGLFFVHHSCDIHSFLNILRKEWPFGFIGFGKFGPLVKNSSAISYAMKYVTKDMDFSKAFDNVVVPKVNQPFHIQSQGFGAYIIEHFALLHPKGFQTLVNGVLTVPDKRTITKVVQIPQYIQRKCLYNLSYDNILGKKRPVFVLNSLGNEVQRARIIKRYEDNVEIIRDTFNNIENIVYDSRRLEMLNRYAHTDFRTSTEIRVRFQNADVEKVALYSTLFKDRVMLPVGISCDCKVPFLMLDTSEGVKRQIDTIFNVPIAVDSSLQPSTVRISDKYSHDTYNYHPAFVEYDRILDIVQVLCTIKAHALCAKLRFSLQHQSNLKLLCQTI